MSIIRFADAEQGFEGIVSWDEEPSEIYKEFASNIEEYEEEVDSNEAEKSIDFGYRSLFLEVVEHGVFG